MIHQTDNPITKWQNKHLLIIGDIMLDKYIHGKVERISPEAPVPVVLEQSQTERLGGAANVALNVKAMGGKATIAGVIGNDTEAQQVIELLTQQQLASSLLIQDSTRPTTLKTRILAGQQILRVDREVTRPISEQLTNKLLDNITSYLSTYRVDGIIFQDYNKGVLTPQLIQAIINIGEQQNIPIIVDPKHKNFFAFKTVQLFKPNLKEIQAQCPFIVDPTNISSLRRADDFIRQKLQHKVTMITLSEHGIYMNNGTQDRLIPTSKRDIVDVCGAGDTVLSVAGLSIVSQIDISTIGQIANIAGGKACENTGVTVVDKNQLLAEWS